MQWLAGCDVHTPRCSSSTTTISVRRLKPISFNDALPDDAEAVHVVGSVALGSYTAFTPGLASLSWAQPAAPFPAPLASPSSRPLLHALELPMRPRRHFLCSPDGLDRHGRCVSRCTDAGQCAEVGEESIRMRDVGMASCSRALFDASQAQSVALLFL